MALMWNSRIRNVELKNPQAKVAPQATASSWLNVVESVFPPRTASIYAQTAGTHCATDERDGVDLVDGDTRLYGGLLERKSDAIKDRGSEFLMGVTAEL